MNIEELKLDDIDFKWVDECDNQAQLHRAIKLIEEDGDYFPDLKKAIQKKLQNMVPNYSKNQNQNQVSNEEKNEVLNNLENWSKNMSQQPVFEKQKHEAENLKIKGDESLKSGDFEESIEFYQQAIKLNSNNELIYGNQAFAYTQLKKYKEAVESASQAISINKNYVKGYYRRAKANESLQNFLNAYQDVLEILRLEPSNSVAKKLKEQYQKKIPQDQLKNLHQLDQEDKIQNKKQTGKVKIQIEEQSDETDEEEEDEQQQFLDKKQQCTDLIQKGDFNQAIKIFESYVRQDNVKQKYRDIWLASMCNLSHCYKQQQNDEQTLKICDEIIEYFEQFQNQPDQRNLGMLVKTILRKAFSLERQENLKHALQSFLLAQKFQPYNPQANSGVQRNIQAIKNYDDQFDLQKVKTIVTEKYQNFQFVKSQNNNTREEKQQDDQRLQQQQNEQKKDIEKQNKKFENSFTENQQQNDKNMTGLELDKLIELKNEGNSQFKNKDYKKAIKIYSQAIQTFENKFNVQELNQENQKVYIDILSNRSLSYFYYQQYQKGIQDMQNVLKLTPDNQKAMYRMALNCEGLTNEIFNNAQNALDNNTKLDFYQQAIKNAQQTIKYSETILQKESNNKIQNCLQNAKKILQICQKDILDIQKDLNKQKEQIAQKDQQESNSIDEEKQQNNVKSEKIKKPEVSVKQPKPQLSQDFQQKAYKIAQKGRLNLLENYKLPSTSSQFETELKSFGDQNDLAYQYVLKTPVELIQRFYQNNQIESTTLLNIFKVIECNLSNEENNQNLQKVWEISQIIPKGKKFKLSVMMLLKKEKDIIKNVIEKLQQNLTLNENDISALKQSYKIKQF